MYVRYFLLLHFIILFSLKHISHKLFLTSLGTVTTSALRMGTQVTQVTQQIIVHAQVHHHLAVTAPSAQPPVTAPPPPPHT